jgi:hypothetical protein
MAVTDLPVDNGVNVEALLDVRDALADTPEIAQFQWRATCSWVKGTHSKDSIRGFVFDVATGKLHEVEGHRHRRVVVKTSFLDRLVRRLGA